MKPQTVRTALTNTSTTTSGPDRATATAPFHGLLTRSVQLDALGYLVIAALLLLVAVLSFMLFNSVQPPEGWLFEREPIQLLALALICAVVLYLLEQHSRLRNRLKASLNEVDLARDSAVRFAASLTSAHHAAEIMVSITEDGALQCVVDAVLEDFAVDAVAIMTDDPITRFAETVPADDVLDVFTELSLEVVRTGAPIASYRGAGGAALAVPLRVFDRLRGVLCLWQPEPAHLPDVEGVALLARVVELGWESRLLYEGTNSNAKGLANLVVKLVDQHIPGYASKTKQLIAMLERLNTAGAFSQDCLNEVTLAATLRDVGLLGLPSSIAAERCHADVGAQLIRAAGLPHGVEEAVQLHHEPLPGDASQVGPAARALSVCVARTEDSGPAPIADVPTASDRLRLGHSSSSASGEPTAPTVLFSHGDVA